MKEEESQTENENECLAIEEEKPECVVSEAEICRGISMCGFLISSNSTEHSGSKCGKGRQAVGLIQSLGFAGQKWLTIGKGVANIKRH